MPNVIVSSITVSDGRGTGTDLDNRETTAIIGAGTTLVTYDNEPAPLQQTGYVEVCKDTAGPDVTGLFAFTITTNTDSRRRRRLRRPVHRPDRGARRQRHDRGGAAQRHPAHVRLERCRPTGCSRPT